jgi:hypothetical protein
MEEFEENKKRMIFVITGDIYIGLKNFTLDLLALHVEESKFTLQGCYI